MRERHTHKHIAFPHTVVDVVVVIIDARRSNACVFGSARENPNTRSLACSICAYAMLAWSQAFYRSYIGVCVLVLSVLVVSAYSAGRLQACACAELCCACAFACACVCVCVQMLSCSCSARSDGRFWGGSEAMIAQMMCSI